MNRTKSMAALVIAVTMSVMATTCADRRCPSESKIRELYRHSVDYNQTAAFIAGLKVSQRSPLYRLTRGPQYAAYRDSIGALWEQYRKKDLDNIEKWRRGHVRGTSGVIMYPFSGPDILNALAFFPGAEEFVMIGLETPGAAPDPFVFPGDAVYAELWRVKTALRTILQLNLFRTAEMHVDLKPESLSGITGLMMFFLARYGYDILDVKRVYIDRSGAVAEWDPRSTGRDAEGVEVVFRKRAGAPLQTARFFSIDLSDPSLSVKRGFSSFLAEKKRFTTLLKSASYLLSYDTFQILRSYLLAGSEYVLQEDSGIPLKYFSGGEWKISLYGTYRLLPIFANRFQRDLDTAIKTGSKGLLPFSFGYGFDPEKSNLMIAEPAKKL
jgi:hypothetical protein